MQMLALRWRSSPPSPVGPGRRSSEAACTTPSGA